MKNALLVPAFVVAILIGFGAGKEVYQHHGAATNATTNPAPSGPSATTNPAPATTQSASAPASNWGSICQDAKANSQATYTVTDENGNKADVTYCGYSITDSADGQPAFAGSLWVNGVFLVTADQAASFDSFSIISQDTLFIGTEANCGNDGANGTGCPALGRYSGDLSYTGYANNNLPPSTRTTRSSSYWALN